jgi:hypothetical protein
MDQIISACNDIAICATVYHKVGPWVTLVSQLLLTITLLATVLVRIPALAKYEGPVNTFKGKLLGLLSKAPTLGKNPQTKKLEEALKNETTPIPL